jgi:hypothetical protein
VASSTAPNDDPTAAVVTNKVVAVEASMGLAAERAGDWRRPLVASADEGVGRLGR